ncbi:hypothetical protein VFA_002843 [Vibrio furnissii CIP 102972]|nr:hypothetical protein VFA_002843 [Vibrio furnissii CIP 102972]
MIDASVVVIMVCHRDVSLECVVCRTLCSRNTGANANYR